MTNIQIDRKRNNTVDILRALFAILIVAFHTSPFIEFSPLISYFSSQTISRLAVPFFASVSGYYLLKEPNSSKLLRYLKKIVIVYFFWTSLMVVLECIIYKSFTFNMSFLIYLARVYFLEGWHQLWYLLAIIYVLILLILCLMLKIKIRVIYLFSLMCLCIGICEFAYGEVLLKIPFFAQTIGRLNTNLQTQGLFSIFPFFMMGYLLNHSISFKSREKCGFYLSLSIVGYILEIIIVTVLNLKASVTLCFFTYPIVYFLIVFSTKYPLDRFRKLGNLCSYFSNFTYYSHYIVLLIIPMIVNSLFHKTISETGVFFGTIVITTSIGTVLFYVDNRFVNKFIR